MLDFITIGSATLDIFIESDRGKIIDLRDVSGNDSFLGFNYGAKIEIDKLAFDIGGGAVNTSVNFSNLGFNTSTIVKMGNDLNSQAVKDRLKEKKVDSSLLLSTDEHKTGFSVILNSFEGDRTVLAHRGANSHLRIDEIQWDKLKEFKWLYIAPLSGDSNLLLDELSDYAEKHNINLAFNPGTTQIRRGIDDLQKVVSTAEILIMNADEASEFTKIPQSVKHIDSPHFDLNNEDADNPYEYMASEPWLICVYKMLIKLKSSGAKLVVITNGANGVVAFDGEQFYLVPPFPVKVVSTLGAGDAFASTLTAGIKKYQWDIEKALTLASINASSVVQSFGAQTALKTFDELESILEKKKKYIVIKKDVNEIQKLVQ